MGASADLQQYSTNTTLRPTYAMFTEWQEITENDRDD